MPRALKGEAGVQQLSQALAEVRELDRRSEETEAVHGPVIVDQERTLEKAKTRLRRALRPFQTKRGRLMTFARRIAEVNREFLLAQQRGKTFQVPGGGTVAFHLGDESVDYAPLTEKEMIARIEAAGQQETFIRYKPELNLQAVKANRELAEKLGLRVERGPEKVIITP